MFKKLLSNLPFNPSLIGQVSFYAKRLHRESAVRRAGLVMMVLTMMLQMFAVISPPQASLQASPNTDLLNGGFSSKEQALDSCKRDVQDFKKILEYFGITCGAISNAEVDYINPRDHNNNLYSMGRLPSGTSDEVPLYVPGAGKFYTRHFWQMNHESSYKVLKVKTTQNKTVYILYICGNIVSIGIPEHVPPTDVCENKDGIQATKEDCDVCPNRIGIQLKLNECDACPAKTGTQTKLNECDVCPDKAGIQNKLYECDVCPNIPDIQVKTSQCDVCPLVAGTQSKESECKPCENSQTRDDLSACIEISKSAKNTTQGVANANGTTVKAGDVIEYTLTTKNIGKITIQDHQVSEPLGDVLDYADIVNLHGGTKGAYDMVSWPKKDIKAGESLINKITVKVKDPIPQTPISSSDPMHFDMKMTNVYGNSIEIKLPQTPVKQVEIVATQLPNTGPGTSLAIGFTLAAFIAYFFMRSRLLARELDIVRTDFGSAGGY